jgi:hypothetical protein
MTLPELTSYPSTGLGSGSWDVEELLDQIATGADGYTKKLERFTDDLEFLRDSEAIERYAHAEAHKLVSERAFSILLSEMRQAVADTDEYNLPVFTDHLESALVHHMAELITIEPSSPGVVEVDIYNNMLLLMGRPDQWVQAVKEARGNLGLGNISDAKVRSKIWKEIYQIDREGGVKIHPTTNDDVTEKYVGKYFATIAERMKAMADTTIAPWWYYIHHGNAPAIGTEGGEPYPKVDPTNFVTTAEQTIKLAFETTYDSIKEEAERVYTKYLQDDYGLEGYTTTFQEVESQITDIDLDDLLEEVGAVEKHEAVETVLVNNKWYDVIKTSGGNIGLRYNLQKNR